MFVNIFVKSCPLLPQFLSRPFVAGDSITVQSTRHVIVSGTVERITPLRTLMRTDDDVLVTVPNKVCGTTSNL
jgi:small-conductance mechanosensitive channel